jgi:hypothetical protein
MLGAQLIALPALFAVLLTLFSTPFLVAAYRRRVGELMKGGERAESTVDDATPGPHGVSHPVLRNLGEVAPGVNAAGGLADRLRVRQRRAMLAYAVAGLCHASVLTVVFAIHHAGHAPGIALVAAFLLFCLPTVPTALHLGSASRARSLAAALLAGAMVFASLGIGRSLAVTLFELHLLIPALLLVVINLRFWRGVAPLVLLLGFVAALGWTLGFAASKLLGGGAVLLWALRLAGLAAGVWAALQALRWLGRLRVSRSVSDHEIFLDSWWLLYSITQTVIFLLTTGNFIYLGTLLSFVVFFKVRRALVASAPPELPAPRMLLLRVFGGGIRAERLFDRLALRWCWLGPIDLIGGRDLAIRQITPLDFAAFLTRTLDERFIRSSEDLNRQLAVLGERAADGRWSTRVLYCRSDTWQTAMRRLEEDADLVVMDLRDFAMDNEGCRYELRHLARSGSRSPVLVLADESTDRGAVESLVAEGAGPAARGREWWVTDPTTLGTDPTDRLISLLAGQAAQPAA